MQSHPRFAATDALGIHEKRKNAMTSLQKGKEAEPRERAPELEKRSFAQRIRLPELAVFAAFAATTLFLLLHHEVWRDEAQGYLLVRDLSIPGLLRHLPCESQFALWYLLIWPLGALGAPVFAINVFHWLLSCATCLIFLWNAPFRLLTRAAIVFSLPFFFEYTIVARSYAIAIFLLVVILSLWSIRRTRPIPLALLVALCASTTLASWGCLLAVCATMLCEWIREKRFGRAELASVLIAAAGFLLALLTIRNDRGGFGAELVGDAYVGAMTMPLTHLKGAFFFLNGALCVKEPLALILPFDIALPVSCVLTGLFLLSAVLYFLLRSPSASTCFLVGSTALFGLAAVAFWNALRHWAFLPACAVMALWMLRLEQREANAETPSPAAALLRKWTARCAAFAAAWCLASYLLSSVYAGVQEVRYDYSHGKLVADFIDKNFPKDVPIFYWTATYYDTIMAYLPGRKAFIMEREEMGTYSKWNTYRPWKMDDAVKMIEAHTPADRKYALFIVVPWEHPLEAVSRRVDGWIVYENPPANFERIYDSADHGRPIWNPNIIPEQFIVYLVRNPRYKQPRARKKAGTDAPEARRRPDADFRRTGKTTPRESPSA